MQLYVVVLDDGEKPRHKTHHSDSKSSKLSSAGDGKRRSSVGDEFVQKKKYEVSLTMQYFYLCL